MQFACGSTTAQYKTHKKDATQVKQLEWDWK